MQKSLTDVSKQTSVIEAVIEARLADFRATLKQVRCYLFYVRSKSEMCYVMAIGICFLSDSSEKIFGHVLGLTNCRNATTKMFCLFFVIHSLGVAIIDLA